MTAGGGTRALATRDRSRSRFPGGALPRNPDTGHAAQGSRPGEPPGIAASLAHSCGALPASSTSTRPPRRRAQAPPRRPATATHAAHRGPDPASREASWRIGWSRCGSAEQVQYDLDTVCRRDLTKDSTTRLELKTEVGDVLTAYVGARRGDAGGPVGVKERKRCWTLSYPHPFHLDVLPAIPNPRLRRPGSSSPTTDFTTGSGQTRSHTASGSRSGCRTSSWPTACGSRRPSTCLPPRSPTHVSRRHSSEWCRFSRFTATSCSRTTSTSVPRRSS